MALLALSMFRPTPERAAGRAAAYMQDSSLEAYACQMNGADAGLIVFRVNEDAAEILSIATESAFRGLNIGRFMIEQTIGIFRLNAIEAETDDDAVGFYRRCGFSVHVCGEIDGTTRYRCRKVRQ
ncbi:MAG: GNAT family N-acetyltransferase [Christensenellaceae bacterium]|nr:GNAT family N-acetyltransferase [Christensenellaceae bacterium]